MQSDALTLLNAILPSEGWYCGWRKDTKAHFWTQNREELAEWCLAMGQHIDVYHACASFKTPTKRVKGNVKEIKALRLDMDTGDGKPYPDQQAALSALGRFCVEHSLPRPWVVGSGGGLHVYYPLTVGVDAEKFVLLANQLRNKCHDGLFIDEGCTIDPARILRTPGTFNYKDPANPRPVRLLCAGGTYAPERLGLTPAAPVPRRCSSASAGGQSLTQQLAAYDETPDADADRIVEQCFAIDSLRGLVDNPHWFAGMSVLSRCFNGLERAREWSEEHRLERIEGAFERSAGPATCEHFQTIDPDLCDGCPHRDKVTSPIQLGRVVSAPPAPPPFPTPQGKPWGDLPLLPYPFGVNDKGEVVWRAEAKDGSASADVVVSPHPIYVVSQNAGEQHDKGQAIVLRSWGPHDGWKEIEIAAKTLFGNQGIAELEGEGVIVYQREKMLEFLRRSRAQVKDDKALEMRFEQFGWKYGNKSFVLGRKLFMADGERSSKEVPIIGTPEFNDKADAFVPKGSRAVWRDAVANFAGYGMEAHAYMAVAPFAAPFMQFFCGVGEGGVIIHGWSDKTGAGKSTSLFGGMAGIGDPARLRIKSGDTVNSRAGLFSLFHTLPICFDELEKVDPELLHHAVMQFTSGECKAYNTQNNVRTQRNGRWATMLLMTANFSLMSSMSARKGSVAQLARIVELRFPDGAVSSNARLYNTFKDHYGWGGAEFFPYIVRPDINQWLREHELPRVEEKLRKGYGLDSAADRFQLASHTCVWVAIEVCKTLGLHNLSPQRIIEAALKNRDALKAVRGDRPSMLDMVGKMQQDYPNTVIYVAHEVRAGVKQKAQHSVFQRLYGRYEANTGTLYFSWEKVQEMLHDEGVSTHEFYKTLMRAGVIKSEAPRPMDITRDVYDQAPCRINAVMFDLNHPLLGRPRLVVSQPEGDADARLAPRSL